MKIGVISDTHIPERANRLPQKILEDFKNVDMILHAGDLIELKVLEDLRQSCPRISAVWGNMDLPNVRGLLSEKEIIKINDKRIGLTHGFGHPSKLIELVTKIFKNDAVEAIIFGHSHYPINETRAGVLYFNPGSPTDKLFSPYNSYGILEITDNKIEGKIIKLE